jgi:hypothetical protein
LNNRLEPDHRGINGRIDVCAVSRAMTRRSAFAESMTNSATSFVPAPVTINAFQLLAAAVASSETLKSCPAFYKPHDQ